MPELPEVETTVRGLRKVIEGELLTRVEPRRADLRRPIPVDLRQRLTGARVTALSRRAKYGIIATDRDDLLVFHLGMSGRWRIDPADIGKHDHLVLETGKGRVIALCDPRRFGSLDLISRANVDTFPAFAALGPEPLGLSFDAHYLKSALNARKAPIKALLLDQRVVAGLGNIYVCEALHMAGIAPTQSGANVSTKRIELLVGAIKSVLNAAISAGGSTLKDFAQPDGELGYFFKQWRVYGREGEQCTCGKIIQRQVQSGRSTFYCTKCQR